MESKSKFWFLVALVILAIGGAYRMGFRSGSRMAPQIVEDTVELAAPGSNAPDNSTHAKRLSIVKLAASTKVAKVRLDSLQRLVRYQNEAKKIFAVTKKKSGRWEENLALGYADGGPKDNEVYLCDGKTTDGSEYDYYSSSAGCGLPGAHGVKQNFTLAATLKGPMWVPIYLCGGASENRYMTLNGSCESADDRVYELLGYARAEQLIVEPKH